MRKRDKQGLLELIRTVYNAHDEIKKLLKLGDTRAASGLIADCQESLLNIGEVIIQSEGEQFVTIGLVEDYCREIFNVYNSVSDITDFESVRKTLNRMLTDIKKSIDRDVVERKEIVFMPYKASMWDSLESVWKAADADPECDAYVVPIPYYDRNPDHSFGEFHYEGGEYPDYVPVTHYNNYDISKRRPDVIYIHNPYDDCNYVTSVDPRFYSMELKKYTDKLVYIPYFVLGEINPDDENALENIAHFVLPPGVINADEVIVQSENMKKAYVNVLLKNYGDTEENRKMFEQKILGTGSPKFDKIASMSKEDVEIPDEWKRIIFKPDGTRKKVVFYNNSVGALLENDEKMLEKMRSVFNTFFEHKDEVALLWRPHPLIKATIESMRPHLWLEYKKMTDEYIDDGWGIYDDTSDLDRAVFLSDVYLGDGSSVLNLFYRAGKKVYYQYYDFKYTGVISWNGFFARLLFYVNGKLYIKDNKDYFYTVGEECSFEFSCSSISSSGEWHKFNSYFKQNDNIWIIPNNDTRIMSYDMKKNKIEYLKLELFEKFKNTKFSDSLEGFSGGFLYNNKIFLIPYRYQAFVAYDIVNKKTIHCVDLRRQFESGKFHCWVFISDNTILLPNQFTNQVVEFNLDTYEIQVHKIGTENSKFVYIHKYNNVIYLVDMNLDIIKWDYFANTTYVFKCPFKSNFSDRYGLNNDYLGFWYPIIQNNMISYDRKIIFMDSFEDMVLQFDCDSCEYSRLDVFNELVSANCFKKNSIPFSVASCLEKNELFFIWKNKIIYKYDIKSGTLCRLYDLKIEFTKEQIAYFNSEFMKFIIEASNYEMTLIEWCGKKIHDNVKKGKINL